MANRIFVAFAKEDENMRDLLKGQSLNTQSDFEYVDMSVKEPYSSEWKERVRTRIRGSAGVIALISKNTPAATGEKWEIECAIEEGKPLLGLWIYKGDRTEPSFMQGQKVVVWTWEAVTKFIDSL
jgi:MTH538 TIR-like domain (DUF1863)